MPHSKDPNRYDPGFAAVLQYMEEGQATITIECKAPTKALSFKMRLYGYAEAWKAEGLATAKAQPEYSKMCFDRAKIMARYKLTSVGTQVVCESRDREDFEIPEIHVSGGTLERVTPEQLQAAQAEIQKPPPAFQPNQSKASQDFMKFLDEVDKPGHKPSIKGPVGPVTAEDLNGPDSESEIGPNSG